MGKIQKMEMADGSICYSFGGKILTSDQMKKAYNAGGVMTNTPDDQFLMKELMSSAHTQPMESPDTFMNNGGKKLSEIRNKPGGSNVGKSRKTSGPNEGPFVGPSGGSPKGSFPVTNEKQAKAALSYSRNAPNPSGIKNAVYKIAHSKGWFANGGNAAENVPQADLDKLTGLTTEGGKDPKAKNQKTQQTAQKPDNMQITGYVNGKHVYGIMGSDVSASNPQGQSDFSQFNQQPSPTEEISTNQTIQGMMKPIQIYGNYGDVVGSDVPESEEMPTFGKGIKIDANGNVVYESSAYEKALKAPGFVDATGKYIDESFDTKPQTNQQAPQKQQTTNVQQVKQTGQNNVSSTGTDKVKQYQKYLNTLGANISEDGIWGPKTQAAYEQLVTKQSSAEKKPIAKSQPFQEKKPMGTGELQKQMASKGPKGPVKKPMTDLSKAGTTGNLQKQTLYSAVQKRKQS